MGEKLKGSTDRPRKLQITFKDSTEGIRGAVNLRLVAANFHVEISPASDATLEVVLAFDEWGGPQNRTVVVTLADDYNIKRFAEELKGSLEKFEFIQ